VVMWPVLVAATVWWKRFAIFSRQNVSRRPECVFSADLMHRHFAPARFIQKDPSAVQFYEEA